MGAKIALSAWSCHSYYNEGWTNAQFIEFAATTDAQGVELLSFYWNPERDPEEVKDALARTGLKLACFGASNNFADADPEKRQAQLADIKLSIDNAVLLGAGVVRVFAGDLRDGLVFDEVRSWIIDGLKEASAYAEEQGIVLCLENHGLLAGKAEQVAAIIQDVNSPNLRSTFDAGNFLLVDEDPSNAVQELKSLVRHVHVKDFVQVEQDYNGSFYRSLSGQPYAGRVTGEGVVDLPFIIGQLKEIGYDGWYTVEYEGDEEQQAASKRALATLEQLL
ncbi:sugar phosphate isomerase/epimerase family protein [Paenibacillus gorillae]|uniref:sugar phosphate isomerase/epimerase family protein n=1 Tax=Paenibacillus gorillae TaxID=1243662 RepID=UPI0004AEC5DC|nr:sugar phosphate isomerase/epimerase family protein [Paenibacillus gorillae]